jgi:hypothetical protein
VFNNNCATFSVPGCDHAEHAALRACLLAGLGTVGTMLAEKPLRAVCFYNCSKTVHPELRSAAQTSSRGSRPLRLCSATTVVRSPSHPS